MKNLLWPLGFLLLAAAADPAERFDELARGFDPEDSAALERIRPELDSVSPACFLRPMLPGPLRSVLARELSEGEVRRLLGEARADPESLLAATRNLASRPGLPGLLLELDLLPLLAAADAPFLAELATRALQDGETDFAAAVLSLPSLTLDLADELAEFERPEGLRFLADVVLGRVPVPPGTLALLPLYEPDVWNREVVRPLGAERIAALSRLAAEHPDHALRALAARLLFYAGEAGTFELVVAAFRDARSAGVSIDAWHAIGRWYGRPVLEPEIYLAARYEAFEGAFEDGVYPDTDPEGAELHAALLRRFFAECRAPRLASAALRILDWNGPDFLSRVGLRAEPMPSYARMLEEFTEGRDTDPPDLAAQKRDFARRHLARVGIEKESIDPFRPYDSSYARSAVHELLPKSGVSADWGRLVGEWLSTDPAHLYDPAVHHRLTHLPPEDQAAVARSYPPAEMLRLLRSAPSRYMVHGSRKFGDDGCGRVNRGRVLTILRYAPERCEVLLTPDLVADFPPANRRHAGRLLHLLPDSPERRALLEDEETFAGFLTAVLELPRGEELDLAARVVSGLLGTDLLRKRIADWADHELRLRLAPEDDEPWPEETRELSADLRAPLIRVIQEAADPLLAWVAARILAMSGRDDDVGALVLAGKDLDLSASTYGHPLLFLADSIDSPARLGTFLWFIRRNEASPRAQAEVFARIAELRWIGRLAAPERETALGVFYDFVTREVPTLDSDRPEAFLAALLTSTPESMAHRARAAYEVALPKLPLPASRIRLRHLASAPR